MRINAPSRKIDAMHGLTVLIAALLNGRIELCVSTHAKFGECFEIVCQGRAYDVGLMIGDAPCLNDAAHLFHKLVRAEESRMHAGALMFYPSTFLGRSIC